MCVLEKKEKEKKREVNMLSLEILRCKQENSLGVSFSLEIVYAVHAVGLIMPYDRYIFNAHVLKSLFPSGYVRQS